LPADTLARLAGFTELAATAIANAGAPAAVRSPRNHSRSACDGAPAFRPYAAASSSARNSTGIDRKVGRDCYQPTRSDRTVTRSRPSLQRSEKYRHVLIAVVSIGVRAGQLGGTAAWLSSHLVSHA